MRVIGARSGIVMDLDEQLANALLRDGSVHVAQERDPQPPKPPRPRKAERNQ